MSELSVLFPEPVHVRVGKRVVTIHPVRLKHFEAFGQASAALISLLRDASVEEVYAFAKRSGALALILAKCTSLPRWRVWMLPTPVAVSLMIHVVRVNNSFFAQALQEMANLPDGPASPNS